MFSNKHNLEILYDVLDMYTKEVAETLVVPPELENYQFSKRFERRMQRLIKMQRKSYYKYVNTTAKRVANFAVIILLCAFVTVFSVKSLREPFINFVVETYEKFTSLFVEKDEPADNVEFEVMLPTYIPEGYELYDTYEDINSCIYRYKNEYGIELVYKQRLDDFLYMKVNTEDITYEKLDIFTSEGILYQKQKMNCLTFENGNYVYNIEGYIEREEIIKIAKSIEKV